MSRGETRSQLASKARLYRRLFPRRQAIRSTRKFRARESKVLDKLFPFRRSPPLASSVNIHKGRVTNQAVAETFGFTYAPLFA